MMHSVRNMKSTNKQLRATFNDTKNAQEKLREKLDTLEVTNSFVENQTEFFTLLADALLGLDFEKQVHLMLPDNTILKINNLGKFTRQLSYLTTVDYGFLKKYGKISKNDDIQMRDIWQELKFEIFGIYPEALMVSIKISKELTHLAPSESGKV